jgi:hypothetical protein
MGKIIVVGDIHLRDKHPYYEQAVDILNSIFSNDSYNNADNTLLFLGDLVEKISASYELIQIYVDLFLNKSKFKSIKILKGNHDSALLRDSNNNITHSTVLSVFTPFSNVEIIDTWKVETIGELKLLFLPHYDHEGTELKPLEEVYSNLHKELTDTFDYAFTHVEDETNHFGTKYCDLSKLHVKQYLNGHIHIENLSTGGRYLGSPGFNSSAEKEKTPYIAIIDIEAKTHKLEKVERLVSYLEVTYPNALPSTDIKYPIYTVFDSIDKQETIDYYSKQIPTFYCRKVFSKLNRNVELITGTDYTEKTILQHFDDYQKSNNVSKSITEVCLKILENIA